MSKPEATLLSVTIKCPVTGADVTASPAELYWSGFDDECDVCGSHGETTVDVKCLCGDTHEVKVREW